MDSVKIIVLHNGSQDYFRLMLNQLKEFNKVEDIVVLSDTIKEDLFEGIAVEHIRYYNNQATQFERTYIHLSSNFRGFELFCIQRWFIINEYLNKIRYNGPFIHIDSDVLVYRNVNDLWTMYSPVEVTICNKRIPAFMFFKSRDVMNSLCDYIFDMYDNNITFLQKIYKTEFQEPKIDGGICDMRLIEWWIQKRGIHCIDISNNVIENSCCDSIFSDSGIMQYDVKRHQKKVVLKENKYYFIDECGRPIRCNCLHFQGQEKKRIIHKYYLHSVGEYPKGIISELNKSYFFNTPKYITINFMKKIGVARYIKYVLAIIKNRRLG